MKIKSKKKLYPVYGYFRLNMFFDGFSIILEGLTQFYFQGIGVYGMFGSVIIGEGNCKSSNRKWVGYSGVSSKVLLDLFISRYVHVPSEGFCLTSVKGAQIFVKILTMC